MRSKLNRGFSLLALGWRSAWRGDRGLLRPPRLVPLAAVLAGIGLLVGFFWVSLGAEPGGPPLAAAEDCIDRLGDTQCDDPIDDPDDDGCSSDQELAMGFDPDLWYDFYDVPVPAKADIDGANGVRNGAVTMGDVLAVLFYVGTSDNGPPNANGVDYDSVKGVDLDGDTTDDAPYSHGIEEGQKYDRRASPGSNPPWDAGPPDTTITVLLDVLTALQQVGLECDGVTLPAAWGDDPNDMAVDADASDGDVDATATYDVGQQFEVGVNITTVTEGWEYAGYDAKVSFDPAVLEYADPPGVTYTGLGGMTLQSAPVVDSNTVYAAAALTTGSTNETGQAHRIAFECIAAGETDVHLVERGPTGEPPGIYSITLLVGGMPVETVLTDAHITCTAPTPLPRPEDPTFSVAPGGASGLDPADLLVLPGPTPGYTCGQLGLTNCGTGDDVDAISRGVDGLMRLIDPEHPDALFYFSVAPGSVGLSGTGVNKETIGCPPEPEADEFGSTGDGANSNFQAFDGDGVPSCANPPAPSLGLDEPAGDDLDAVDPLNITQEQWPVFVSLERTSPSLPSLPGPPSGANIYVDNNGSPGIDAVYLTAEELGLDPDPLLGDDIDALCITDDGDGIYESDQDGAILFSLTPDSPTLGLIGASPADILIFGSEGPGVLVTAAQLGLQPTDDVDALKCYNVQHPAFSLSRTSPSFPDPASVLTPGPVEFLSCLSLGLSNCAGGDNVDALASGQEFGYWKPDGQNAADFLFFSVDENSKGLTGTAVSGETDHPSANCDPSEPQADEFGTNGYEHNNHFIDGDGANCNGRNPPSGPTSLSLVEDGAPPNDDVDALAERQVLEDNPDHVYLSLDPTSPSLGMLSAADVLVADTTGTPQLSLYAGTGELGLSVSDDIDALCVKENGDFDYVPADDTVWFSLAPGSQTLKDHNWSAADILAAGPEGVHRVLCAEQIGLQVGDNVDALKCYMPERLPAPCKEQESRVPYNQQGYVVLDNKTLGGTTGAQIWLDIFGGGILGSGRFEIHTTDTSWPGIDPDAWGKQIGEGSVELEIFGKLYTLTGVCPPCHGPGCEIPIRSVDPATVHDRVLAKAGIERADLAGAFQVDTQEAKLCNSIGAEVSIPYDSLGLGYGLLKDLGGGKTALVLTSGETSAVPLHGINPYRAHLHLFDQTLNPHDVMVNPEGCGDTGTAGQAPGGGSDGIDDCAGYYVVSSGSVSYKDPLTGEHHEDVDFSCDYFGGTEPTGSDDDHDCIEDCATFQPGRPSEWCEDAASDLIADRDDDGLADGLEVHHGCNPTVVDTDGDGLRDYYEFLRGTKCDSDDSDEPTPDGVGDLVDNCPTVGNADQTDTDRDGMGDACDPDDDDDGLTDVQELTIHVSLKGDTWVCEYGTFSGGLFTTNPDSDGDTYPDGVECWMGSNPLSDASVPEICDDDIDNDADGLYDEAPDELGTVFVEHACTDNDGDGLWVGDPDSEIMFATYCIWTAEMGTPQPGCDPADHVNDPDGEEVGGAADRVTKLNADIGDGDPDADDDGLTDGLEARLRTDPGNPDSDGDGCTDGQEVYAPAQDGGTRDPTNPYDFYDVPVPTAFNGGTLEDRDGAVSILNDVLAVLEYSGTSHRGVCNSGGRCYDDTRNGDCQADGSNGGCQADGSFYDRSAGETWSDRPDLAVSIIVDVLLVLDQSGHSCH